MAKAILTIEVVADTLGMNFSVSTDAPRTGQRASNHVPGEL